VEELQTDLTLTSVDLEALIEKMRVLTQKAKKANFYHHQMVKFKSSQMEHAFIKAELLMPQSQGHKNKIEL
jgi:hypothetical protein